jgi:hypothetical protein
MVLAMKAFSEFAVIATTCGCHQFFVCGSGERAEGKTSNSVSRSQMSLMYAMAG